MNFYLVLDTDNRVVGCQTTGGIVSNSRYILVDQDTYSRFSSLGEYEFMTYDYEAKEFSITPDSRPNLLVEPVSPVKLGDSIVLELKSADPILELFIEYLSPDNSVGIAKAKFVDGIAGVSILPKMSGYYSIISNPSYKINDNQVIVYEE